MKKVLSIAMVLVLAFSLTACNISFSTGSQDQPDSSSSQSGSKSGSDSSSSQLSSKSDSGSSSSQSSNESGSDSSFGSSGSESSSSTTKGPTYGGKISDLVLSVDGDNVSLKDKANVLSKNGWEFDGDKELSANTVMDEIYCRKNGHRFEITSTNLSDSAIKISDGTITEIQVSVWDTTYSIENNIDKNTVPKFSWDGKINNDSTKSDVINIFGQPTETENKEQYERLHYEDNELSWMDFYFSKQDNGKIGWLVLKVNVYQQINNHTM